MRLILSYPYAVTNFPTELRRGTTLEHYTILERIGVGGMGEVYRAKDNRLSREVAIKLVRPVSSDPDRLRRFEQEARAAAALNHPNILSVFQMGTHEGAPYLVSEILEGATLRERLKRGPMPVATVLDYGLQIAHGLAAAHERGIVHRDLKPENLFATKEGRVKILDFGLAKLTQRAVDDDSGAPTVLLTEPGVVMGTVGYMSPEQVMGKAADHRADIFAFGGVLYEMLTGKRAFQKPTAAETMTAILNESPSDAPDFVPASPALQSIVRRCLEKNPERRVQSASDLAFELEALRDSTGSSAAGIARQRRRRIWPWAAALVAIAVGFGAYFYSHRGLVLTERDSIVVADFTNTTGDSVFDGTLQQGLSVQLEQTPFLHIISADQIAQTLRLMEQRPDERLTPELARQVCQRVNATIEVDGSIAALGNQYVIGLDAVDCQSGETLAREQTTADGKEKVLAALERAASDLRSKLGESHASIQRFNTPMKEATTGSLEALKAYSLGYAQRISGHDRESIPYLERAIKLDSDFAMAYAVLATSHNNVGELLSGEEYARKAFERRSRASEQEGFYITGHYYDTVTGDLPKGIDVYEQWRQTYPRDPAALVNLAWLYKRMGQHDRALDHANEAMRLEPGIQYPYAVSVRVLLCLNRPQDVRKLFDQATARKIDNVGLRASYYLAAFLQGDTQTMEQQATLAGDRPRGYLILQSHAATAAYSGQLEKARELYQRANSHALSEGKTDAAAAIQVNLALTEAMFGDPVEARRDIETALAVASPRTTQALAAVTLALAGDGTRSQALATNLNRRFPEDTAMQFRYLPVIRAILALRRPDPHEAIETLEVAVPYDLAGEYTYDFFPMIPVYIRGEAYLSAHQGAEAAAEFQKILDHPGIITNSPIGALARRDLGRAYAMQGDTARAKTAYKDFLELWKSADRKIPVLTQAQAEYANLK